MSPPVNPHVDFLASGHWCRIAQDQSKKVYLPQFLCDPQNAADPAFKVSTSCSVWSYSDANKSSHKNFYNNLLCHLLACHLSQVSVSDEPEYTSSDLENVKIQYTMIFSHATTTIHYMAYDITVERVAIRHRTSQLGCACIPYWDATASGHTDRATNVARGSLRLSEPESQKRRTRARSYASLMCIRHTM